MVRRGGSGSRSAVPRALRPFLWVGVPAAAAFLAVLLLRGQGPDERDTPPVSRLSPEPGLVLAPANAPAAAPAAAPADAPAADSTAAAANVSIHLADDSARDGIRLLRRKVIRVLDGDSVVLDGDEQARLIGIDTPEKGEPYSDEARSMCKRRIEGKEVLLELDAEERDHYGRLLAHLWIEDPATGDRAYFNGELVRAGLARVYPHEPNRKHREELAAWQEEARAGKVGIWSLAPPEAAPHYVGSRSGSRFHRPDCPHAAEIAERNRTRFATREEALSAGKSPCRSCKP